MATGDGIGLDSIELDLVTAATRGNDPKGDTLRSTGGEDDGEKCILFYCEFSWFWQMQITLVINSQKL